MHYLHSSRLEQFSETHAYLPIWHPDPAGPRASLTVIQYMSYHEENKRRAKMANDG